MLQSPKDRCGVSGVRGRELRIASISGTTSGGHLVVLQHKVADGTLEMIFEGFHGDLPKSTEVGGSCRNEAKFYAVVDRSTDDGIRERLIDEQLP